MKHYLFIVLFALAATGIIVTGLDWLFLSPDPKLPPAYALAGAVAPTHAADNPCAFASNGPMGRIVSPGLPDYKLQWDKDCPSGMRWVK